MNTKACLPPADLPAVRLRRVAVGGGEQVQVLLRGVCIADGWVGDGLIGLPDAAIVTGVSARVPPEAVAGWPVHDLVHRMVTRFGPIQFEELLELVGPADADRRARLDAACDLLASQGRLARRVDEAGVRVVRPPRREPSGGIA